MGNLHNIQVVDGAELLGLGGGRTGHTGQLGVETEEVLERDGGQGLALSGDLDAFLGFDGLMETLVVAAAVHETAGELVNNDDLIVLDHIVNIPLHETPGLHGLVDVVGNGGVLDVGQVFSIWKNSSTFLMPLAVRDTVRSFSSTM